MSIITTVLIVSAVINVFCIILAFLMYTHMLNFKNQMQQLHSGMSTALTKLFTVEHMMTRMGNGFTEFIRLAETAMDQMGNGKTIYKTSDGKFTAKTIEELIDKIKKDGSTEDYFSDEELDKLKRLFDNEDDDFDDEE